MPHKSKGSFFVISGPAGSGKGTVVEGILKKTEGASPGVKLSVSFTTRNPRPNEREGVNYFFVSKETFHERLRDGKMLEHTEYCGNFYGTPAAYITEQTERGNDVILEIETDGAMQVKRLYPETVLIFVMPESKEQIYERLVARGTESGDSVKNRMAVAEEELETSRRYDYIVVNETGKVDKTVGEVLTIIRSERLRVRNNMDFIESINK